MTLRTQRESEVCGASVSGLEALGDVSLEKG